MIAAIDQCTQAIVRFRHRYFVRLHIPSQRKHKVPNGQENSCLCDSWWVELNGDADDCGRVAGGVDALSGRIHQLHGFKPLYVTRGTVCTLKFLERKAENWAGGMGWEEWRPMRGVGASAFVVCAWDSSKDRHEPFVKWRGRRESLNKAIATLASYHADLRDRVMKAGILDMVCPEPPPKTKRRANEKHIEIAGDVRVGL